MERADFDRWKNREVARLIALVENERRYYQEIVASVPVGLLIVSSDLRVVSANRAFRVLFSLGPDEVLRRLLDDVLPAEGLGERVVDVISTGVPQHRALFDLPGERLLRISIVRLRAWDEESEPEALLTVEDLSDFVHRKPAEPAAKVAPEAPREAEAGAPPAVEAPAVPEVPAEVVVEAAAAPEEAPAVQAPPAEAEAPPPAAPLPDAAAHAAALVWEADPESLRPVYVNRRLEELLGYPAGRWVAEPDLWSTCIHPEDRAKVASARRRAAASGVEQSLLYRAIGADGQTHQLHETVRRFADPDSGTVVLAGVAVEAGGLLREQEHQLETAKMEALARMAAGIAHELNNVVMILQGYGEDLHGRLAHDAGLRGDLEEMLNAAARIAELNSQLVAASRRPAAEVILVDVNAALRAAEDRLRAAMPAQVGYAARYGAEAAWTKLPPGQLEEITQTLAAHAASLMAPGGTLELETEAPQAPETRLRVSLRAKDLFLEDEARRRFLEPYSTRERGKEGGLGLLPVYGMIRQAGGDVWVQSDPGRGTTIEIRLPAAEAPPEIPEAPAVEEAPEAAVREEAPPETILVVEDEAGIRALVRKILHRQGYNVLEASRADEALEMAQRHEGPIHLLVTDLTMPGIGGRELTRRVQETRPEVRVLYVSGYTDDATIQAGELPPGAGFLQKPFTLATLLEKVREILTA